MAPRVSTLDHRLPPMADLGKVQPRGQGHFRCPTPLASPHHAAQACWDDGELEGRISCLKKTEKPAAKRNGGSSSCSRPNLSLPPSSGPLVCQRASAVSVLTRRPHQKIPFLRLPLLSPNPSFPHPSPLAHILVPPSDSMLEVESMIIMVPSSPARDPVSRFWLRRPPLGKSKTTQDPSLPRLPILLPIYQKYISLSSLPSQIARSRPRR